MNEKSKQKPKMSKTAAYKGILKAFGLLLVVAIIYLIVQVANEGKRTADDYDSAKKILMSIYSDYPYTFYIDCKFDIAKMHLIKNDCSYVGNYESAYINWEHIFPVSRFGNVRSCWSEAKYNKRDYCEKNDKEFKTMMADMHNIVPTINTINSARGNFDMAKLSAPYARSEYGGMKINRGRRQVEPLDPYKGAVARAYLYMSSQYGLPLTDAEKKLFDEWNAKFAPTTDECEKNQLVKEISNKENTFITSKCEK